MAKIQINLFQDRDSGEVTILPRIVSTDRIDRFGDAMVLDEEAFHARGLASVQEVLHLFRDDPHAFSKWTTDNTHLWDLYLRKPKSIVLEPSPDLSGATFRILHFDNVGVTSPCEFGEEVIAPLGEPSESFASVAFAAFARSKDFVWIKRGLWDAAAFFCVYRDDRTGLYHWFDWVKVAIPDRYKDAVTAWGPHRVFDHDGLRLQCQATTIQSLEEFAHRKENENPNPNPRGSQVEDAGVADQKRVVVYQRNDPEEAFIRVYNLDSTYQDQVESGIEFGLPLNGPEKEFQEIFLKAFEHCAIE